MRKVRWSDRPGPSGQRLPGAIKVASTDELESMMIEAAARNYSGVGRPVWVAMNLNEIKQIALYVSIIETRPEKCYRCKVAVTLKNAKPVSFLLDIPPEVFVELSDIPVDDLLNLTRTLMGCAPQVPFEDT
jgi:hypothetical protein